MATQNNNKSIIMIKSMQVVKEPQRLNTKNTEYAEAKELKGRDYGSVVFEVGIW